MADYTIIYTPGNGEWVLNYPVTLRQWFYLLAGIFGKRRCTPFDQMELLLCLKEQGFEL